MSGKKQLGIFRAEKLAFNDNKVVYKIPEISPLGKNNIFVLVKSDDKSASINTNESTVEAGMCMSDFEFLRISASKRSDIRYRHKIRILWHVLGRWYAVGLG